MGWFVDGDDICLNANGWYVGNDTALNNAASGKRVKLDFQRSIQIVGGDSLLGWLPAFEIRK